MSERLLVIHNGAQVTIQLNRPDKLNAINVEMLDALDTAVRDITANREVRVVLLTGAGDKAFSVGADIHAWSALEPLAMWHEWIVRGHHVFDRLAALHQPVIAVLDGYAFGGGLELALAADIRLASDKATFAAPEVKLGTVPGWAGTQRLPEVIGLARAKQMIFTGARIDARRAYEWGLVNEVLAGDELMSYAQEMADQICANAPVAVQISKQLVNASAGQGTGRSMEALASALTAMTADNREGLAAYREKREADFKGK